MDDIPALQYALVAATFLVILAGIVWVLKVYGRSAELARNALVSRTGVIWGEKCGVVTNASGIGDVHLLSATILLTDIDLSIVGVTPFGSPTEISVPLSSIEQPGKLLLRRGIKLRWQDHDQIYYASLGLPRSKIDSFVKAMEMATERRTID